MYVVFCAFDVNTGLASLRGRKTKVTPSPQRYIFSVVAVDCSNEPVVCWL